MNGADTPMTTRLDSCADTSSRSPMRRIHSTGEQVPKRLGWQKRGAAVAAASVFPVARPAADELIARGGVISEIGDVLDVNAKQVTTPGCRLPPEAATHLSCELCLHFFACDLYRATAQLHFTRISFSTRYDAVNEQPGIAEEVCGLPRTEQHGEPELPSP